MTQSAAELIKMLGWNVFHWRQYTGLLWACCVNFYLYFSIGMSNSILCNSNETTCTLSIVCRECIDEGGDFLSCERIFFALFYLKNVYVGGSILSCAEVHHAFV